MKKKKKTNKNLQPNQVVCAEMTGLDTSSVGKVPSWHPTFADDDSSSNSSISIPFKNNTRKKKKKTPDGKSIVVMLRLLKSREDYQPKPMEGEKTLGSQFM